MFAFLLISFVVTPLIMWFICLIHLKPGEPSDQKEFFLNTIKHKGFWVWFVLTMIIVGFFYIATFRKDLWL